MKVIDYYWDHPELKEFIKQVPEGYYLFKQGDPGHTMFIIVRGIVQLVAERDGVLHRIGIMQAGQFLGEKAILSDKPHKRALSAHSKSSLTVAELSLKNIEHIQKVTPALMTDILKRSFQIAAERLDNANQLMSVLRSSDNAYRFIHLILYFSASNGRKTPEGTEVFLTSDGINFYLEMSRTQIDECLRELETEKLLLRRGPDCYTLTSRKALLAYIPALSKSLSLGFGFSPAP